MRKQAFCICENKDADQLCGNHEAKTKTQISFQKHKIKFFNAEFLLTYYYLEKIYISP